MTRNGLAGEARWRGWTASSDWMGWGRWMCLCVAFWGGRRQIWRDGACDGVECGAVSVRALTGEVNRPERQQRIQRRVIAAQRGKRFGVASWASASGMPIACQSWIASSSRHSRKLAA